MKYQSPKLFVGPVSKNTVDAVIEYSNTHQVPLGLIPSRRQIDFDGGYVNGWNTLSFCDYVRSKSKLVVLQRDHGGPYQGKSIDDGEESFLIDNECMDIIHVDPWKLPIQFDSCLAETIYWLCRLDNPLVKFEIGTEQAIRPISHEQLVDLLSHISRSVPKRVMDRIKYCVIQSGTALLENKQVGEYDESRLSSDLFSCHSCGLLSKEHNGDYLSDHSIKQKFMLGLNSINIAPEFGMIETCCFLDEIEKEREHALLNYFYDICYNSNTWCKWIGKDFDFNDKKRLIKICGHYLFSTPEFEKIKYNLRILDNDIKSKMKERIHEIVN